MLREAIVKGTELGKEAQAFIDKGEFVTDEVVIGIVKERLSNPDCKNGYILDGFPRTLVQAEALDKMLPDAVETALLLEVSDESLIERLSGRRECPACKATFHIANNPSKKGDVCDKCGAKLVQRADDTAETIKKRMSIYHAQTEPIKDYYKACGKLKCVSGERDLSDVTEAIFEILGLQGGR
jgi:adenylate kinase